MSLRRCFSRIKSIPLLTKMDFKMSFPHAHWRIRKLCPLFCALIILAWSACSAFALEGDIRIHDPSTIIKCDGVYYVFGTGRGIPFLTSADAFTWQRSGRVFDRVPDSVHSYVPKNNGMGVWAPEIIKLNGEYCLYYAISAWGQFVSAIGLITTPTLDPKDPNYKWTDRGMIVHSVEGENLNAIDPGVIHAPDGTLWMSYGSYHGDIQLVQLDPDSGLRIHAESRVWILASHSEASDIVFHKDWYYLFVNHGSCCSGTNSTYHICVGRSRHVTGPYLDHYGDDMADGGGTLFLAAAGRQFGPGQFGLLVDDGVEKFSCHYEADLDRGGRPTLDIRPLLWTADDWPSPGENVRDGTYQIRSRRTGLVLQSSTTSSTDAVECADYLMRDNQKWTVTTAGGGFYKIIGGTGGNALRAANDSLAVAPFAGADDQLWRIDQLGDGNYRIASKAGGLALTASYELKPGNGVVPRIFTGDDAQGWVITAP